MGTRAVINFQGKPIFATHWDGDPSSLGKELSAKRPKTPSEIFSIAVKHQIDASSAEFKQKMDEKNIKITSERSNIPIEKVRSAFVRGKGIGRGVFTPENYPTSDIKHYNDYAEYEYDVDSEGNVKVRERSGWFKEKKAGNWKRLEEIL